MTEQIVSQKLCRLCNGSFPATSEHFYQHSESKDGLHGHCKACAKKRARTYDNKPKGRPNEILLVNHLLKHNVFADVGAKFKIYKLADVVAWGCVTIEMKYSWSEIEKHKFQFTPRQLKLNGAGVDVICLTTDGMGEMEYHFFDAKDPFFYAGGKLKHSVSYQPYAKWRVEGKEVLTPDMMDKARNDTSVIECYRLLAVQRLISA
jgi:hypothetical protein